MIFNPLYTLQEALRGTLANNEDPGEFLQNAAFHKGLHSLLRL